MWEKLIVDDQQNMVFVVVRSSSSSTYVSHHVRMPDSTEETFVILVVLCIKQEGLTWGLDIHYNMGIIHQP
jgi:hypothetical protein